MWHPPLQKGIRACVCMCLYECMCVWVSGHAPLLLPVRRTGENLELTGSTLPLVSGSVCCGTLVPARPLSPRKKKFRGAP